MSNPNIWAPGESITANESIRTQAFIASTSQSDFTLTSFSYSEGTGSLYVYVSGLMQRPGTDFIETGVNSFRLTTAVPAGTIVLAVAMVEVSAVLDQTFVVSDYYTAVGGETLVSWSNFSYTIGGNHLRVFRNGLLQEVNYDYTETSANSVTFTDALEAVDRITFLSNVFYTESEDGNLRGDLLSSNGSALVGFVAAGTGAVTTNVQNKLRESVSVKDFGAVGDGLTDDTLAIQAALSSGNASVFFPEGEYLAVNLTVPSGVSLHGVGQSTLLKDGTAAVSRKMLLIQGSDTTISDMVIEGGQGNSVSTYYSGNTAVSGIDTGADHSKVIIRNVEIRGWGDGGVDIYRPKDCLVENCNIHDVGRFCVFFYGGYNSHIRDNTLMNVSPGSGGVSPFINAYGFSFTCDISQVGFPRPENCSATGNHIENIPTWEAMDVHGGSGILLSGNTIIDCMIGCFIGPSSGTNNQLCDNVTVIGNSFTNTGTYSRSAVIIAPTYSVGTLYGENFVVANNMIQGYGATQASYDAGFTTIEGAIHSIGASGVVISSNKIRDFHTAGIYIRQHSLGCDVIGNTIVDGTATNSMVWAYLVENTSTVVSSFSGNVAYRTGGTLNGLNILGGGGNGVSWAADNSLINLTLNFDASARSRMSQKSTERLVPKAWAYVTNNGTSATLADGCGIASVTRSGTGTVNVVLSETAPNTTYGVIAINRGGNSRFATASNNTTTAFDVFTWTSNTAALVDSAFYVAVYW